MKFLTLDLVRAYCRIDDDCENELLATFAEGAEETVFDLLNKTYEEVMEEYGKIPTPLIEAALMLVDVSYENRSLLTMQNLFIAPYTIDAKLRPYMKFY
jgi:uncharacterized phage protein (predicted DNA packaging)